jgi:hypothetical protein
MLKRSNAVVKGKSSRRTEVVSHEDVTWMDMDTWYVCHMSVGFEPVEV